MASVQSFLKLAASLLLLGAVPHPSFAFDISRTDNVAVYWGQNSYGATHSDTANFQQKLSYYCQDDSIDAFPVAFVNVFFGTGGYPSMDLSNICSVSSDPLISGTGMPDCSFLAADIETCQSKGKIVTISLGGATGADTFSSDAQAQSFADTIWNVFLGGSSSVRPFGTAVLDGVDLDIEGGSSTGYVAFVNQLRSHYSGASKSYYVTGAPQCPFPDAYLGSVISATHFDALYVQFYNNFCGLTNFNNANDWNFGTWDNWAKTVSPNPNVKIYIGAPASSTAAGSGYVDVGTLGTIATQTRSQYSSFGGVMLWDASQAYANGRYDAAIKAAIKNTSAVAPITSPTTSPTTTPTSTTPTSTSTTSSSSSSSIVGTGNCASVAAWMANIGYPGGSQVIYNGHLWTAKWWSEADTPGGPSGDWTDDGLCATAATGFVAPSGSLAAAAKLTVAASKASTALSKATVIQSASSAKETAKKASRFFKAE